MSPETILALLHHQLDSLYPEMATAIEHGSRFRVSLYMSENGLGVPLLTVMPKRSKSNVLELQSSK
jgi:hypothetical protein